jgi:SAM-dependent methyltransferase
MRGDPALAAYEAFAPVYNSFNHANDYERWLEGTLLPQLRELGLKEGGTALDVGCGTERAFQPLLRRGWSLLGCDLSPAMLDIAATAGDGEVELRVADMRNLPAFGSFDLVLSLNDSVNHLLGDEDLVRALTGMRKNLDIHGLLVFDVNAKPVYGNAYSSRKTIEHEGAHWVWRGTGEVAPSVFEAEIAGDHLAKPIRFLERFWSRQEVLQAMSAAGLTTVAALGMTERGDDILLASPVNEDRYYKLVFIGACVSL